MLDKPEMDKKSITHGQVKGHTRMCDVHGLHGILYPCKEYSEETLAEISKASEKLRNDLISKEWREKQIAHGLPPGAIAIFSFFSGVDGEK